MRSSAIGRCLLRALQFVDDACAVAAHLLEQRRGRDGLPDAPQLIAVSMPFISELAIWPWREQEVRPAGRLHRGHVAGEGGRRVPQDLVDVALRSSSRNQ